MAIKPFVRWHWLIGITIYGITTTTINIHLVNNNHTTCGTIPSSAASQSGRLRTTFAAVVLS